MKLKGKVAIVTGAGRGIGRGIAIRLAQDGAEVVVNDINSETVNKVVKEIEALGRKALAIVADVSNGPAVYAMVEKVVAEFGKLDIMVANAGIAQVKQAIEITEEDWDRIFAVNAKGIFLCDQAAAKQMIKQKRGKIINCASIAGHSGFGLLSSYSATKFAVVGFTQALAKELGPYGINVNAYCPGIVGTDMWDLIDEKMGIYLDLPKGETLKKFSELITLGRVETPEDVACLVSYLASADADYMTGQAINICGGVIMS
ncbi:2,3-butanediol dehydrogenase, S-alcohol forming, (S)-acetoin-specific [Desulfosporosinus sp. I2]|uniref:2,3-butanediol dehydrogenase, S-alcohol forming, (S)-acetoin-specific n=1 Tax=Desulfosporosinus metallidurans TaxID=1888891 RepID=A0A1Q8QYU8_9FIRM|nr:MULTISPECIES: glucose 1-dehydrogenase [Desulfosporosinus]KJR49156.1 2,3-butanediol dehydrogenase, S-alcohol forming, (S)-acetoin-specific [Desulfosporosinus sp. I2]OLN32496.1 2,3-butanediol dehydrogenase, S-alcohol forming, (S)-acetoin-specific [Desulfosporosinus metallidurans]